LEKSSEETFSFLKVSRLEKNEKSLRGEGRRIRRKEGREGQFTLKQSQGFPLTLTKTSRKTSVGNAFEHLKLYHSPLKKNKNQKNQKYLTNLFANIKKVSIIPQ